MARSRRTGILAVCLLVACPLAHGLGVRRPAKYEETIKGLLAALKRNPQDPDAHFRLGCAYARTSEFDKAVHHLEQAQQLRPGHEDTLVELASAYLELSRVRQGRDGELSAAQLERAESTARTLLQLPPKRKESYEFLIRLAQHKAGLFREANQSDREREMYDEVLGYCEKVLELDPNDLSTHLDRIRTLFALRRYKDTERHCNEVLRINDKLHEPKLIIAQIRRAEGDNEGAIKILSEILAQKPTQIAAMLRRAEIYLDLQKYEEALADANEALRLTVKNPYANFIRGCVYMQLKKLDQALPELQFAATGLPKHVPTHFWLARCLLMKDRLREAIEELNIVVKLDPRFTSARFLLANAHLQNGDPDAAIAALENALQSDPKDSEVCRLLGLAYLRKGDHKRAEEVFAKMLAIEAARDNPNKTIEHCLKALEVEPKNVEVRFLLGLAYLRKESLDEAKTQFEEVLKLSGRHPAARLRLAEIHTRRREFDLAQRHLEACIADDPKLPAPRYELSRLYALQGQFDKAQAELEKLLTLDPDKAKAQRALDDLRRQKAEGPAK